MIKSTLHNFTLESKDLLDNINTLEKENNALKQNTKTSSAGHTDIKEIQTEFTNLKKQYADLEEKYLDLKLEK